MKFIILSVLIVSCASFELRAQEKDKRTESQLIRFEDYSISLIRLIATPEKYHDKRIQVIGYLNLEFEGDAIYLHKEDYKNGITRNGFWVSFSEGLDKQVNLSELNKRYVLIEGTFDKDSFGHMGLFGGEIKEITRIIPWRQ